MIVYNWKNAADEIRDEIINHVNESPPPLIPNEKSPETTWRHVFFPRTNSRNIPKDIHCEYGVYQEKISKRKKIYAALHFEKTYREVYNESAIFTEVRKFRDEMNGLGDKCQIGPFNWGNEVVMNREIIDSILKDDIEWTANRICKIYKNFTVLKERYAS
jgi:hypothetical protein